MIINLTPHTINVINSVTLPPSGEVARVEMVSSPTEPIEGIPSVRTEWGEVANLPEPVEGVVLLVSGMVAQAVPREDVVSPGELVRDEQGRPIGCRGLRRSC